MNAGTPAALLDHYLAHLWPGDPAQPERRSVLLGALEAPGDEAAALEAAVRIASCPADVVALGPLITALVKADGRATPDETRAVQRIISTIRTARGV